jgi:Xaa-Pro aminopeptidase
MTDSVLIHADSLRDPDLFFATGITVVDPFTYIETGGRRIVLTSSLEADAARRDSTADEVWLVDEFDRRELIAGGMTRDEAEMEVVRRALTRAGVSRAAVPPTFPLELADFLRAAGIEVEPDRELFVARRRVKDDRALDGIRRAQRSTEESFRTVRELLGSSAPSPAGLVLGGELLTCERIRDAVEQTLRAHGCDTDPPIIACGPQSAQGHELGSGPIQPGQPLVCDIFPRDRASRMHADMTRTFCFGPAPDWLAHMHATVLEALRRSTEAIRPGVGGRAVWDVACDVIEGGGYRTTRGLGPGERLDEDFFHGLGHGVGVDVHEEPGMSLGQGDVLATRDVVTVEPGVYRKDRGGVRLEDLVLVTESGHELLTDFGYELEIRP